MDRLEGKSIIFSNHAKRKMTDRGASEDEVLKAIKEGSSEPARKNRIMFRKNLPFNTTWSGKHYSVKQVAPVIAEENDEAIVVTVYVYYF